MRDVMIFDIQRASLVDGPGIRTVVFFKGCNLRCEWCHNPESWSERAQIGYFERRCVMCGRCAEICPARAIDAMYRADPNKCTACGRCEAACPASARKLYGKRVSTGDIMRIILADKPFYATSGGGVTFSGGECMLTFEALIELLNSCRAEGVSAAIDTAGNVPYDRFERALPLADWILYDVKCVSGALSQRLTGADGALILDNLCALSRAAPEKLIVRVPVIPGANDARAEMDLIASFIARIDCARVELMPYHKLGEAKAQALGRAVIERAPPTDEYMAALRTRFNALGVNALNP